MSPFDHILIALLLLGVPLYQHFYGIEQMKKEIEKDEPGIRKKMYWQTIGFQWLITALVFTLWFLSNRTGNDLGFSAPAGLGFWIGLGVAVITIVTLSLVLHVQTNTPQRRRKFLGQLNEAAPFLPRDRDEMMHMSALAITAGFCEEIIYRGYLIWYAMQFTGDSAMGTTLAVLLPALFFGLAHLYQGPKGMIQVFVAGLVFGGLYILTGSLWVPMLAHAVVDIKYGMFSVYLNRMSGVNGERDGSEEPTAPDSASPVVE